MAWSAPKGRPKVFQTRLKTFVRTLRRSETRKSGRTGEKASPELIIQSEELRDATHEPQPNQSQSELDIPVPQEPLQKQDRTSSRFSTEASLRESHRWEAEEGGQESSWDILGPIPPQDNISKPGLSVCVSLRFEDPLEFTFSRNYDSSPTLRVTENLCAGLIRRIDHTCYELITRKDPNASAATKGHGRTKPKRFELITQISHGGELWATRTYTSYQKEPLTAEAAKEVILSSNRMVGLFLKRHDPDFVWKIGPLHDNLHPLLETQRSPYRIGSIQSLDCVPRSEFIEKTQTFEATPGYKLDLEFTFLNRQGEVPRWQKEVEVPSNQTTPLTLAVAETLFSDASYALEGAVRSRRRHVQEQHAQCRFVGGTCQHYIEEASGIVLKVTNNFGPNFDHLVRTIQSKLVLFEDGEAEDCTEFVENLQKAIAKARDAADEAIAETNDLDLKIVELRGSGWTLDEPLVFTLPPSASYSRRSIEAILDRVQTGIGDVLRGNAATVRYVAWKRGHFILDKTLVAREPKTPTRRWDTPYVTRSKVVNKLRRRVEQDIEMICKDTCSLDDMDDEPPSIPVESTQPPEETPAPRVQPDVVDREPSLPKNSLTDSGLAHIASSVSGIDAESSVGSHQLSLEEQRPGSPVHSVTSMTSHSSKFYRDPKTGARAFPLVPSASTYGVTELLKQPDSQPEEVDPSTPYKTTPTDSSINDVLQDSNSQHASSADSYSISQPPQVHDGMSAEDPQEQESVAKIAEPKDASINETDSEPARSTVSSRRSASGGQQRQADTGDQGSTVPSTPSLIFGSGQSHRSSLILTTPPISGSMSSADLELIMARRDSEVDAEEAELPSESIEAGIQKKFIGSMPEETSTVRLIKPKHRPSPLQHDVSEEGHNSTSSNGSQVDEASGHDLPEEVSQNADGASSGSVENRTSNATLVPSSDKMLEAPSSKEIITSYLPLDSSHSQANTSKNSVNPPKTPSDAGFTFTDNNFAQTREEFDFSSFSSPWSTSSPPDEYTARPPELRYTSTNGELRDDFYDDNEHAIAEDSHSSMALSVPPSPTQPAGAFNRPNNTTSRTRTRHSFGSAGLLGFADSSNMIKVGLRQALAMGGTLPRRKASFPHLPSGGGSPLALRTMDLFGTRELQVLKRPSLRGVDALQRPASSGREFKSRFMEASSSSSHHDTERSTADPAGVMRRSLSSNVLQDLQVREVAKAKEKKKITLEGNGVEDKGEENSDKQQRLGAGRARSPSLMFLLAGVTLASQMMRPE